MKHCHPVIILICALTFTNAMALDSSNITSNICTPAGECLGGPYIMTGCVDVTCTRYKLGNQSSIPGVEQMTTEITSCNKCSNGYTRTSGSVQCGTSTILAYKCVKDCPCPSTCRTITDTVIEGYIRTQKETCNEQTDCKCKVTDTTYSCASKYYQSEDKVSCQSKQSNTTMQCSGCTACPTNYKTCSGKTFTCKDGYYYYESDNMCKKCPTNSTCYDTYFECKDGYYESNSTCQKCPTNSTCYDTYFECKDGYYYYESGNTCQKCPDNSECDATGFKCRDGYYESGSTCQKCPDGSTCTSASNVTCNKNYYKSGSKCESCGVINTNESDTITMVTGAAGATDKSECYLPDEYKEQTYDTTYNGHNVTVRLTGFCSKN